MNKQLLAAKICTKINRINRSSACNVAISGTGIVKIFAIILQIALAFTEMQRGKTSYVPKETRFTEAELPKVSNMRITGIESVSYSSL
jgi:hypothetical protein